ncbi:hypothetical protein ILUMI_19556 [Ignelater luminosus]|uniref:PiggyBac transposable element-derived protein domain-containing protein n=1 Tax=Ignelater luminosus TaxID=2038154 RepID=A0A8K0G340_IGNLU|nr:hypothetical protein ILUMI_19556 [Ignelater luminosus]
MSKRKTAAVFNIPRSTLQFHLSESFVKSKHGPNPVLSVAEENTLLDWILECQNKNIAERVSNNISQTQEMKDKTNDNKNSQEHESYDYLRNICDLDLNENSPENLQKGNVATYSIEDIPIVIVLPDVQLNDFSYNDSLTAQNLQIPSDCEEIENISFHSNENKLIADYGDISSECKRKQKMIENNENKLLTQKEKKPRKRMSQVNVISNVILPTTENSLRSEKTKQPEYHVRRLYKDDSNTSLKMASSKQFLSTSDLEKILNSDKFWNDNDDIDGNSSVEIKDSITVNSDVAENGSIVTVNNKADTLGRIINFAEEEPDNKIQSEHDTESELEWDSSDEEPGRNETNSWYGKDQTKWSKIPSQRGRIPAYNIISVLPGLRGPARQNQLFSPLESWQLLLSDSVLEEIVDVTNKKVATARGNPARFSFLLACLKFDDLDTRIERAKTNKLAAISEIFQKFVEKCKACYCPGAYVTVDEI